MSESVPFRILYSSCILSIMKVMGDTVMKRPFTGAIEEVRRRDRLTYQELADRSGVRSSAWFHKQLNDGWGVNAAPVGTHDWAGFAKLLGVRELVVRQMIAEEWFGITPGSDRESARANALRSDLERIDVEDFRAVQRILRGLPTATDMELFEIVQDAL